MDMDAGKIERTPEAEAGPATAACPDEAPSPWPAPVAALTTVVCGTAVIDPARLGLLLVPLLFLLAAHAAGRLVEQAARQLPPSDQPAMLQTAVHLGVGVAVLSLFAMFSASLGLFRMTGLAVTVLATVGLFRLARAAVPVRLSAQAITPALSGIVLGLMWLTAWLWATIPSTFYDELAYHLVIPERALATGSLPAYPWVLYTLMPQASDLLLAWGMAVDGDLGARALHWSFWAWGSMAAWGLLDALLLPRSLGWTAALITGALASSPTLWFLGTLTFAETCLTAALVTAAGAMVASDGKHIPWLSTGLLLGLAATVKLNGLAWMIAGLAAAFVLRWPGRRLALAALLALASIIPWWARAARITGNPIYPLAYEWLGSNGFWNDASQALLKGDITPNAVAWGLAGTLRLPWDLVLHPERFGSASDVGVLAIVATGTALLLPVIHRVVRTDPRTQRLGDAAAVFLFVAGFAWAATTTTTRFFAPAWLFGLVVFLVLMLSFRKTGAILALAVVIPLGIWGTIRFLDQHEAVFSATRVALGKEARDAYLGRTLDHYEAAAFVRRNVPANATLLFIGEARPYYFSREAVAPYPFNRHPLGAWVEESDSPEALAGRLAREKITHVVLNVREFTRLHDKYGMLAFTGEHARAHDDRLKRLPLVLQQMFSANGVYVFAVPGGT